VRVIELSNHPETLLEEERTRRLEAEREAGTAYEQAVLKYGTDIQKLRETRDRAHEQHRWRAWLLSAFLIWLEQVSGRPRKPPASALSDREERLIAGMEAEEALALSLCEEFDDEWALFRGYRNRAGEIDQLLLGPAGLMAIEVKHRNATVRVKGDHWGFDRYDNYGNLVKQGMISDARGRSPARQLREPTAELEDFLTDQYVGTTVDAVVLLSHPHARLATCEDATVAIAFNADQIVERVKLRDPYLERGRQGKIEELIVHHHESNEERLRQRAQRSPQR